MNSINFDFEKHYIKPILDSITRLTTIVAVTVPLCLALPDTQPYEAVALTYPCPVRLVLKVWEVALINFPHDLIPELRRWPH